MSQVRFLLDEDVAEYIADAVFQREPAVEILLVGQDPALGKGTVDPDLLRFCESEHLALVTRDRNTMVNHVKQHLAKERHTWGVFFLKDKFPTVAYAEDLILIWSTSEAEEWQDRFEWLPWLKRRS